MQSQGTLIILFVGRLCNLVKIVYSSQGKYRTDLSLSPPTHELCLPLQRKSACGCGHSFCHIFSQDFQDQIILGTWEHSVGYLDGKWEQGEKQRGICSKSLCDAPTSVTKHGTVPYFVQLKLSLLQIWMQWYGSIDIDKFFVIELMSCKSLKPFGINKTKIR